MVSEVFRHIQRERSLFQVELAIEKEIPAESFISCLARSD
jgi:hypothetical protein